MPISADMCVSTHTNERDTLILGVLLFVPNFQIWHSVACRRASAMTYRDGHLPHRKVYPLLQKQRLAKTRCLFRYCSDNF